MILGFHEDLLYIITTGAIAYKNQYSETLAVERLSYLHRSARKRKSINHGPYLLPH
jgi:hypothetical protein